MRSYVVSGEKSLMSRCMFLTKYMGNIAACFCIGLKIVYCSKDIPNEDYSENNKQYTVYF